MSGRHTETALECGVRTFKVPILAFLSTLILAGCAGKTRVEQVPVEVEVPIEVPCVASADIPERPQVGPVTKKSAPGEKIAAIVYHRERLIIHSAELEALLSGCVD